VPWKHPEGLLINFNLRASLRAGWKTGDTAMSELITMTELTDTELDAVCGGFLNFNWGNTVSQSNSAENFSMPVLSFVGGATTQTISQTNSSNITQTFSL
jgi:hypothetical protein